MEAAAAEKRRLFLEASLDAEDAGPLCVSRGLRYGVEVKHINSAKNAAKKKREMASIERWLGALHHPDVYVRADALVQMAGFGRDTLSRHGKRIASLLAEPADPAILLGALKVLAVFMGKTEVMGLHHGDYYRGVVINVVLTALGERLLAHPDPAVRAEALALVAALEPAMRVLFKKRVLALVEDGNAFVRMAAIEAARTVAAYGPGTTGRAKGKQFLEQNKRSLVPRIDASTERHPGVRLGAFRALGTMAAPVQARCAKQYAGALEDDNRRMRLEAVRCIAHLDGDAQEGIQQQVARVAMTEEERRKQQQKQLAQQQRQQQGSGGPLAVTGGGGDASARKARRGQRRAARRALKEMEAAAKARAEDRRTGGGASKATGWGAQRGGGAPVAPGCGGGSGGVGGGGSSGGAAAAGHAAHIPALTGGAALAAAASHGSHGHHHSHGAGAAATAAHGTHHGAGGGVAAGGIDTMAGMGGVRRLSAAGLPLTKVRRRVSVITAQSAFMDGSAKT